MYAISTITLLSSLATSVLAQGIDDGSFQAFTEAKCSAGGGKEDLSADYFGMFGLDVRSVQADIQPACARKCLRDPKFPSIMDNFSPSQ